MHDLCNITHFTEMINGIYNNFIEKVNKHKAKKYKKYDTGGIYVKPKRKCVEIISS